MINNTQPADMATLREALHHLGDYTGNSGFYTDPDYLAVNAALDKLERARDRIAALEAQLAGLEGEVAILAFARLLATKLHTPKNEAKGDWRKEEALDHWHGVYDEFVKLTGELYTKDGSRDTEARWEAVDVALRAMMLCDVLDPLCDHDGRGRPIAP